MASRCRLFTLSVIAYATGITVYYFSSIPNNKIVENEQLFLNEPSNGTEDFSYVFPKPSLASANGSGPITILPSRTWIKQRNKYWRNFRLPIMTTIPSGRLGNQMGEYATLFALNKIYNVSVVLYSSMWHKFSTIFNNTTLPTIQGKYFVNEWIKLSHTEALYNYATIEIAAAGLSGPNKFAITDTAFEIQLFNAFYSEIKKEFAFSDKVRKKVETTLNKARELWVKSANSTTDNLQFVGFHIRRTDYSNHLKDRFGGSLPDLGYFLKAMKYYKEKYRKVMFILASDDKEYILKHFSNLSDIYVSANNTPEEDLSLLSSCNHSIITVGSFGFWTGYLAGGEVVYPDLKTDKPYRFSRAMYEFAKLDRFVPLNYP